VTQERVDAYEVGFKAPLWERRVESMGRILLQLLRQADSTGSPTIHRYLEVLDQCAKIAAVIGAEAELIAHPVRGLDLSVSGSYLDSEVSGRYITTNGEAGTAISRVATALPHLASRS